MAQLKDTIVSGNLRVTDTTLTDTLQVTTIKAPTSSNETTYGPGTSGQVLKSNGTSVYWGSDSNSVTGVKGNAETSYRTGNVNLTPANIGALALSGGTMTGNITFTPVTSTSYPASSNQLYWSGSTDWAKIYYRVDASDAGKLVFDIGDDTNTRIAFAYNGTAKSYIDTDGNFSGNAATSSSWATARTLTLGGQLTGSVSVKGDANMTLNGYLDRAFIYDDNAVPSGHTWAEYAWHKFAEVTITDEFEDRVITFLVSRTHGSSAEHTGILSAKLRTKENKVYDSAQLKWLVRNYGLSKDDFVMVYTSTSGTSTKAELWCRIPDKYHGLVFTVLKEHRRNLSASSDWTLVDTPKGSSTHGSSSYPTTGITDTIISSDGIITNSTTGTATSANALNLTHDNELNFSKLDSTGYVWFGHRWNTQGTETSGGTTITKYKFGNATGTPSGLAGIEAKELAVAESIYLNSKNASLYIQDSTSTQFALIDYNGSNIWIGTSGRTGYRHKGSTIISTGWTGTLPTTAGSSLTGNSSIYVSIPTYTVNENGTGSWDHNSAEVLHARNYTSYTYSATASRTKNTVLAAPNGSNGAATFRKLVAADLPDSYLPLSGGKMTGTIQGTYTNTHIALAGGDIGDYATLDHKNNINISSWNGVSISNGCSSVGTLDQVTFSVNARTGATQQRGNAILYSESGNSPALIFQRGTSSDGTYDWKLYVTEGHLNFDRNSSGTWTNLVQFEKTGKLYVSGAIYSNNTPVSLEGHTHEYVPLKTNGGIATISGNGQYTWCTIATITVVSAYADGPISFEVSERGGSVSLIQVSFVSANTTDPALKYFVSNYSNRFYIKKTATSTWEIYGSYTESYGAISLHRVFGYRYNNATNVTIHMSNVSEPTGLTRVTYGGNVASANALNLAYSNEINFSKLSSTGHVWFGYRWNTQGTETSGGTTITTYKFGNANGGSGSTPGLAGLEAGTATFKHADFGQQLIVERTGGANMAGITFKNTNGVLGHIAANTVDGDLYHYGASDTSTMKYVILDSHNYTSYACGKVLFNTDTNSSDTISIVTANIPANTNHMTVIFKVSGSAAGVGKVYVASTIPYIRDVYLGGVLHVSTVSDDSGSVKLSLVPFTIQLTTSSTNTSVSLIHGTPVKIPGGTTPTDRSGFDIKIVKIIGGA